MSENSTARLRRIAELARLDVHERELAALSSQFEDILKHFESLARLDVEGVEPMTGPGELADVLRDDRPAPSLAPGEVLANAPEREGDFYAVPKTVGGDE